MDFTSINSQSVQVPATPLESPRFVFYFLEPKLSICLHVSNCLFMFTDIIQRRPQWTLPVLILNLFKFLLLHWSHQGLCFIFHSQLFVYMQDNYLFVYVYRYYPTSFTSITSPSVQVPAAPDEPVMESPRLKFFSHIQLFVYIFR